MTRELFDSGRLNLEHGMTVLLVEQNANLTLRIAHYAYVLENGAIALQERGGATRQPDRSARISGTLNVQLLTQQIVEGLSSGAIYASLALALVLVYRATRIVNFAQGEMGTFSAIWSGNSIAGGFRSHSAWRSRQRWLPARRTRFSSGDPAGHYRVGKCHGQHLHRAVHRFRGNLSLDLGGGCPRVSATVSRSGLDAWRRAIPATNVGVLLTLCILATAMALMFRFTRIGLAMRAAAAERDKSPLVGIHVETMLMLGWGWRPSPFIAAVLVAPACF